MELLHHRNDLVIIQGIFGFKKLVDIQKAPETDLIPLGISFQLFRRIKVFLLQQFLRLQTMGLAQRDHDAVHGFKPFT